MPEESKIIIFLAVTYNRQKQFLTCKLYIYYFTSEELQFFFSFRLETVKAFLSNLFLGAMFSLESLKHSWLKYVAVSLREVISAF